MFMIVYVYDIIEWKMKWNPILFLENKMTAILIKKMMSWLLFLHSKSIDMLLGVITMITLIIVFGVWTNYLCFSSADDQMETFS